uniref:Uncharacterized protein n=1 Tax=Oryza glaberrima TaxID=4538 RepID=I1Q3V5_ORYGL
MADQGRSDDEQVESAAGGTSRSKDMTSSGNDSKSSQGGSNPPPIRQREGQFDYSPAILCKCGYNDSKMDFLSGNNPSRRWYEPETTPYLRIYPDRTWPPLFGGCLDAGREWDRAAQRGIFPPDAG